MGELVTLGKSGDIGIVTINNPPVNALRPDLLESLIACIHGAENDDDIKALVLIGNGRIFSAGGDIGLIDRMASGRCQAGIDFHPLLRTLEDCPKPIVCAIHGEALGGGLQIALACHYRIAVPEARVGEPEVKLGLIPNAGGTQRLPRLAGVAKAVDMCARGEPIPAAEALASGILDRIVAGDLLKGALAYAHELVVQGLGPRRTRECWRKPETPDIRASVLASARARANTRMRGRLAPLKAIEAVEAATILPFEEGCRKEHQLFQECLLSSQAGSLIHMFLSERPGRIPNAAGRTPAPEVRRAAVIGGGTMGSGIAMAYAGAGIPVLLKEISSEVIERSMTAILRNYDKSVQGGRLSREAADACFRRIQPTQTYEAFSNVDIAIEAVFEEIELKKRIMAELDRICRPGVILASNTSTLDIDEIARATSRPDRVVGHHFFAPAHIMRLLEIARGRASSADVIDASLALARKLGKVGVVVGNCRGFVGNRMYHQYQREAQLLLEEGAAVPEVDRALYDFGMAMGPLATADLSGLDVGWKIRRAHPQEGDWPNQSLVADRLCELGRFGQKTGAGWYQYQPGDRTPVPDPEVEKIIEACACAAGITRRTIAAGEIVERTVYALINEGARILAEGIAARAADIDVIYVNGYGFPAHRGGPMWFADRLGLAKVHRRVCEFEQVQGARWAPAPLLGRLAEAGKSFADFDGREAGRHRSDDDE
ncbi:MAG: enoyl-CoA hydratase/isomerase family protein [Acidobacteriia bacterium]|nr:enoyl-CoA hydratase/isomerase family protein [Terriglobia bacterium]